ncbi:unnamed protein product, partial [Polarella glacialis]
MSSRSRSFFYSVLSSPPGEPEKPESRAGIDVNGPPLAFESAGFKGHFNFIHDIGNEPGSLASSSDHRRGLIVQIQGKFKEKATLGAEHLTNLWIGGTLEGELKLGWIMKNVVELCAKFAKKKTGGRMHFDIGSKTQPSQVGFPLKTLFLVITTPEGETPPTLGDPELDKLKYVGPGMIDVDTTSTYTMIWNTPYMDLCNWELLKVPAVSPLPLESVMGDITKARVFVYDLGKAGGSHAHFEQGLLLDTYFRRGEEGEGWPVASQPTGEQTPLDALSDVGSEDACDQGSEDGDLVLEGDGMSDSDDSSGDSQDEEGGMELRL